MYVTDSSTASQSTRSFGPLSSPSSVTVPVGRTRYQYGWRTRGTGDIVSTAPDESLGSTWGAVTRNFVERNLEYDSRDNKVCHYREYEETSYAPGGGGGVMSITLKGSGSTLETPYTAVSTAVTHPSLIKPLPSKEETAKIGSELIRASVPSHESINLVQVMGETMESDSYLALRKWAAIPGAYAAFHKQWTEAKALAGMPTTAYLRGVKPASPKRVALTGLQALGSAFLSYIFGVQPSLSMYTEAAQALKDSVPRIRSATTGMQAQWPRQRNRELSNSFTTDVLSTRQIGTGWGASVAGRGSGTIYTGLPHGAVNVYSPLAPTMQLTCASRSGVRSFCAFERFITRPSGFSSRLEDYGNYATAFLGGGLTPSVAWELTPFSFAVDWFVDVGGILAYQEAIARDNLVAGLSGYTSYTECTTVARGFTKSWESRSAYISVSGGSSASSVHRKSTRSSGSAYGSSGGVLSPTRTAILGALGTSWL